jgi:hypothetical protein
VTLNSCRFAVPDTRPARMGESRRMTANRSGSQPSRRVLACDSPCDCGNTTCGWCLGDHPTHGCPRGPKLSVGAVVAFALEAMARPARGWS